MTCITKYVSIYIRLWIVCLSMIISKYQRLQMNQHLFNYLQNIMIRWLFNDTRKAKESAIQLKESMFPGQNEEM